MGSFRERRLLRLRPRVVDPAVRIVLAAASILQTGTIARARMADDRPESSPARTSYDQVAPVLLGKETLRDRMARDKAERPAVAARQKQLLESRYDLTAKPDAKLRMSRGKPVQVGPATKLPREMKHVVVEITPSRAPSREGT